MALVTTYHRKHVRDRHIRFVTVSIRHITPGAGRKREEGEGRMKREEEEEESKREEEGVGGRGRRKDEEGGGRERGGGRE